MCTDEDEGAGQGGAGADQGKGQMLYIPGIGYIPLSSLGGLGQGLNLGGARQTQAPPNPEGEREWKGFGDMPLVTQQSIMDLAEALEEDEKKDLTILILGKGGTGKSSTTNSLLNEKAANVLTFQQDNTRPIVYSRRAPSGFVLHVIDTPSLLDQDAVSEGVRVYISCRMCVCIVGCIKYPCSHMQRLEAVAKCIKDREVDAVLFLDRLDEYSVGTTDKALIEGVTRFFGPSIWTNTVLCFSRGDESSAPPGIDFYDHVAQRENQVKSAIASAGGVSADMASALIENSSRCPTNADGEKIVAGDVPWIADVLEKVVEVALNNAPYEYSPEAAQKASNPNRRRKWLIPLVLAAQIGAKFLLDKLLDDDGCKGDENGPFDSQTIKERRAELKEEKEERRREKQRNAASSSNPLADLDDDDILPGNNDDDDEWDDDDFADE